MRPTKILIRALRETAHKLRNGAQYCWSHADSCNCGQLAQTILNMDGAALEKRLKAQGCMGSWTLSASRCERTGLDDGTVIAALCEVGMELGDFYRLEFCTGPHGVADDHKDPHAVAAWMDAQADELERRRVAERGAP